MRKISPMSFEFSFMNSHQSKVLLANAYRMIFRKAKERMVIKDLKSDKLLPIHRPDNGNTK